MREADTFIKERKFEQAKSKLAEASRFDPTNPYLTAFRERIQLYERNPELLSTRKSTIVAKPSLKPTQTKEVSKTTEELPSYSPTMVENKIRDQIDVEYKMKFTEELKRAELQASEKIKNFDKKGRDRLHTLAEQFQSRYNQQIAAERQKAQRDAEAALEEERINLKKQHDQLIKEQNENIKKIRAELRKEIEQNFLKRFEQVSRQYDLKMELLQVKIPQTREEALELYREKLRKSYSNGEPTVEGAKQLMELKELLEITFDEHFSLEAQVRLDNYVATVQKKILTGEISLLKSEKLEALKQQFQITPEEESQIQSYIKSNIEKSKLKGRILVVDDDKALLDVLEVALNSSGYDVVKSLDVQGAYQLLKTTAVDLILCDIKFPEGELDGFKLFTTIQEEPLLRKIPFIFMSALIDGLIMRSGVQLGIDDYLTKPVDIDFLLAVIEGKIKRYRSLD